MVQGTTGFVSVYDDNYSVSKISVSAEENVISYKTVYSMQEGMYFEIRLSDGQTSTDGKGTFTVKADGEYTLTASIYEDNTKKVKVCDDYLETFTLTNGEYKVLGAEWTCSTEQNPWSDNGIVESKRCDR
ncbi:MAG: VCBS domain-containing protein [Lachnoclostridium sp.]